MNEMSEEELRKLAAETWKYETSVDNHGLMISSEHYSPLPERAAAEIRRLRAALAERDALLAKAGEVLEPFAEAALRASFDWFVMWDSGPYTAEAELKRRVCTRGDLRRAASLASELKEKQG